MKRWVLLLSVLSIAALPAWGAPRAPDALLSAHLNAVARSADPRVAAALTRINGTDRRLLAMRSYLRAGAGLPQRWSWTAADIRAYDGSHEQRALAQAIARVRTQFEARNRGYTLFVQPTVRTLDVQLERWDSNISVARVAAAFRDQVAEQVQRDPALRSVDAASTVRFAALLRDAIPEAAPTLAAPGLSRHGRMRAVDFIVRRGDETVAGADAASANRRWDRAGWTDRLHQAVLASGAPFDGPLERPAEPWHYEYRVAGHFK